MHEPLIYKFNSRQAVIGIIGLGYVGLPLALRYLETGYSVLGLDSDRSKVDSLMSGQSYIRHIPSDSVQENVQAGRLQATVDFARAGEADALILCVPTPLDGHREPDLTYLIGCTEEILPHLRKGQVISLESTTYPGTTEEVLRPRLEKAGFTVGQDIFLVYSPEREDPGNPSFSTRTIPKVCGGTTPECLEVGQALYGQVIDRVVPVSSTQAAEMTKILENTFRAVNIALVNELKLVADRMGVDIFEVIRTAATKPFGYMPFYPGPGLGGHCIPIDPFYLTWKAREYDVATRFIELAGEVNTSMPYFVVQRAGEVLNEYGKPLKGSRILLLGLSYKPEVDDDRESPTYRVMELLEDKGAVVYYNDPFIPEVKPSRKYPGFAGRRSRPIVSDGYDLYIVCTAHSSYRNIEPADLKAPVLDTRGFFENGSDNVYKA